MAVTESDNFAEIWLCFLELEISRSRALMKFAGSANTYLVLQAISYHQLRLIYEIKNGDGTYSSMKNGILFPASAEPKLKKSLNYSTISNWTGLDKETVRRACKTLETKGILNIDSETGIALNLDDGKGASIVDVHEKVKPLMTKFLSKVSRS